MDRGVLRLLACWLGVAVLLAFARAAPAREIGAPAFAPGSVCYAAAAADEDYTRIAAQPARWNCGSNGWSIAAPRAFLRFDLRGTAAPPAVFSTRLIRFTALRFTVIAVDGRAVSRDLTPADMIPATTDRTMYAPLPQIGRDVAAVVVRVDGARQASLLALARLGDRENTDTTRRELLVAMLCGALFLPLIFNLAFYRILRESFLLWHALATAFMLLHMMVTSGLINRFFTIGIDGAGILASLTVGGGIIAASLFLANLIEPGKIDRVPFRLLRSVVLWVPVWTLVFLFAGGPLRPFVTAIYVAALLPLLGLYIWVMVVAVRRGSRAVIFQIVGWLPLMLTAAGRIAAALGVIDASGDMLLEQHFAMAFEVFITTLGALDRLMTIRRERDLAWAEAHILVDRAERDHLTGLFNRRALERRFPDMRAGGFHAMALLDLDRFKAINDTFGHVKGDAVLRAVAEALDPDGDTLAARLGGEEFLLLLRGKDVVHRAERRRVAITARVAALVPGLDRPVTASMGLVELPADGSLQNELAPLYAHCDRLLYEAKAAGRNRTMREKMQSFVPARRTSHAA
jgi:diguanylate cyclase (GGDEF)-like protein